MTDNWWIEKCDRFNVGPSKAYQTNYGGRPVFIETRAQLDGSIKWIVKMNEWVLGKDNRFYYEPIPSNRYPKFITNTRFDSKEDALSAWLNHETNPADRSLNFE